MTNAQQVRKTGRKIVKGDSLVDGNGITATVLSLGSGFYGELVATLHINAGPNAGLEMPMALRPGGKYDVVPTR